MKAYCVHDGYEAALVFASNDTLARSFAVRVMDTEFPELRAKRWPDADDPSVTERREAHPIEYRNAGFHEADEPTCATCGLSSYGFDEYVVCDECHQCHECGCCDDCALSPNASLG